MLQISNQQYMSAKYIILFVVISDVSRDATLAANIRPVFNLEPFVVLSLFGASCNICNQ